MRMPWQKPKPTPTLDALSRAEDDVVRLFARTILNLQVRAGNTEQDVRPLVGRLDVLEGRDNSTEGSPRGESFGEIHNKIDALTRQVKALQRLIREREEAASDH